MSLAVTQNYVITYIPYLNMGAQDEIDFGFLKIWNFDKKKDLYIPDKSVRTHIEMIMGAYKDQNRAIEGIGIVSIGATDFRKFTDQEYEFVEEARLILFLCFLARHNIDLGSGIGHGMATAENFDVFAQAFVPGTEYISDRAGEIVSTLRGGFKISEMIFETPGYILKPSPFTIDSDLFRCLIDFRIKRPLVFKRIIDSAGIFYQGYYNTPSLSRNARILLQMAAFEKLLKLPVLNQRREFKKIIGALSNLKSDNKITHYSERGTAKKAKESLTIKEIWADLFYTLRNHIIHGNSVKTQEFHFMKSEMHSNISVLFFLHCVRKTIEKSLRTYACDYDIIWEDYADPANPTQSRKIFKYHHSLARVFRRSLRNS